MYKRIFIISLLAVTILISLLVSFNTGLSLSSDTYNTLIDYTDVYLIHGLDFNPPYWTIGVQTKENTFYLRPIVEPWYQVFVPILGNR